MLEKRKIGLAFAALFATGAMTETAMAADKDQKLATGEADTRQLLLLMDKDRNGKVSR